jgi:ABC-type amino acid transport system permease subunit
MEPETPRGGAIAWWLSAVAAIVTAFSLAYIAHNDLGLTREEIRTPSLAAAAIIGLLLATDYFGRRFRKLK